MQQSTGAVAMGLTGPNPLTPANQPTNSNASLYIGDLDDEVSEALLFEKFSSIGQVLSIRVCRDMISKKSLGYAYLNFANSSDAERAIDTLNFDMLNGRKMRIMWSQRDPSLRRSGVGNLFIKNLDRRVTNRELYDTFSLFGEILSCKIATDEKGVSKGYGFIHFSTKEGSDKAIQRLNDKVIHDKKIYVAQFVPKTVRASGGETSEPMYNNVFVKNFGEDMTEDKLRNLFTPFGEITSCKVEMSVDNKSKGFGFVCFKEPKDASEAVNKLNNEEIDGKPLFVGRAMKKSERAEFLRQQFEKKKSDKTKRFQQGVNLYVKNLDDSMDDEMLKNEFAAFGRVTSVRVMRELNGRSKGFGFVCFNSAEDATKAVTEVNGRLVAGKPLYVALAQRKDERKQHLATQYVQRQLAMRTQIPHPQQHAAAAAAMLNAHNPAQAMNMIMNLQNQAAATGGFFPSNVRNMYPTQGHHPPGVAGFQPIRSSNRWNTPQGGHMRGGMMQSNFGNRMMRPAMNMRAAAPRPTGVAGMPPNMRPQESLQFTANARNIQQIQRPQQMMTPSGDGPESDTTSVALNVNTVPNAAPTAVSTNESVTEKNFIATLTNVSAEEQKQMLGERMYQMITLWYPEYAGKLTGMLLELDNRELMSMYMEASSIKPAAMMTAKTAFRTRVDAAFQVLLKQATSGKTQQQDGDQVSDE